MSSSAPIQLLSPAFTHGSLIPVQHTCDGDDLSPPLSWSDLPVERRCLALVCDDPDAPRGTWVHWVLYNLPPDCKGLAQGAQESALPKGTLQGMNDWKKTGYGGPCPPIGRHRYFFVLSALDTVLEDQGKPTRQKLERAFAGHLLAKAELMGTYQKGRK